MLRDDDPDWRPLEQLVATLAGHFMWMFAVQAADGRRLNVYKHIWTRRYLHLGPSGEAFFFTRAGRYREIPADELLHLALGLDRPPWEPRPPRV
jgi:hypothetical protein